jgi:hypothetical protein
MEPADEVEIRKKLKKIKMLQSRGNTLNQIYKRLGIDETTHQDWLVQYGPKKLNLETIEVIAFGVIVVFGFMKSHFVGFNFLTTLLLIPVFISLVTWLSYFLGDTMYVYNKWTVRFEPYEGSWPRFFSYAYIIMGGALVVIFFKLTR